MGVAIPVETRFEERVRRTETGCWEWSGDHTPDGYGRLTSLRHTILVHRYSYQRHVGPIPDGLQLDHLCRNRGCCNPAHLEPVTAQVNSRRGVGPSAVNAAKEACHRGHPFTPENTTERASGARECRMCNRARQRARSARGGDYSCSFCPSAFATASGRSSHETRMHPDEATDAHRIQRRRERGRAYWHRKHDRLVAEPELAP